MSKSLTMQIAEEFARKGWNLDGIEHKGHNHAFIYHHDEKPGRVTVHENDVCGDIITYVGLDECPDGWFDLTTGEFVEG